MITKRSRTIATVLLSCLLLAACTSPSPAASPPSATQAVTGGTTTGEPAASGGWENLSWKLDTSPVTLSAYIDFDWYALDTWGNDHVSQEITKRTGVSLDVTKASDLTQLNVLLASGSLSDIIFTSNLVQRFEDPDVSHPWDELIPQYTPEFMALIDPVEIINNTAADGHFYTLKTHYNNAEAWDDPRNLPSPGDAGFYYREDVMEKIGNPPLENVEDLLTIFALIKEKQAELGIDIIYNPHPNWSNPIGEFMGTPLAAWQDEEGNLHKHYSHPAWKEYLVFMNQLYREGYLYKEAYSARPEDFFQRNRSGKTFAASYNSGLAGETNKIFDEQGIQGKFIPLTHALTYKGEDRFQPMDASIGWASCFISKDTKHPDRAIRYMEFLKSPEGDQLTQWGIEGMHYTLNEDNLLIRPENFNQWLPTETGIGPWYFQASGLGEGVATMSGIANPDPKVAEYASYGVDLLKFRKAEYARNPILYFARPDPDSDEFTIEVKLNDEWSKRWVAIIMAGSEDEAARLYDETIAYFKTVGLDQLEAKMTENYKTAEARYQ